MPKFRKKPVEIEARRLPELKSDGMRSFDQTFEISTWCGGEVDNISQAVVISTLEGNMRADPGDWIIKGVNGEFYPCKSDIFEKTYELVDD